MPTKLLGSMLATNLTLAVDSCDEVGGANGRPQRSRGTLLHAAMINAKIVRCEALFIAIQVGSLSNAQVQLQAHITIAAKPHPKRACLLQRLLGGRAIDHDLLRGKLEIVRTN